MENISIIRAMHWGLLKSNTNHRRAEWGRVIQYVIGDSNVRSAPDEFPFQRLRLDELISFGHLQPTSVSQQLQWPSRGFRGGFINNRGWSTILGRPGSHDRTTENPDGSYLNSSFIVYVVQVALFLRVMIVWQSHDEPLLSENRSFGKQVHW